MKPDFIKRICISAHATISGDFIRREFRYCQGFFCPNCNEIFPTICPIDNNELFYTDQDSKLNLVIPEKCPECKTEKKFFVKETVIYELWESMYRSIETKRTVSIHGHGKNTSLNLKLDKGL